MAKVTICIPVFRAGAFLQETLNVLLKQTYRDIQIELAIEPPGLEEVRICERFSADSRVRFRINDTVLGWAENIAAMLSRVSSPFFVVLPHDDFLHPNYVEWLLPLVENDPDAVVAYGDIQFLRASRPVRRSLVVDDGPVADRLISFLASGGEAPPWRGVTRTSALAAGGFPVDAYRGLLVECEWVFHLLTLGAARRLPRTLYFKRFHEDGRITASVSRNRVDPEIRRAGLEDHRTRLRARTLAALPESATRTLVEAGIDAAIALRFLSENYGPAGEMEPRLKTALAVCQQNAAVKGASRVEALVHTALARVYTRAGAHKAALDAAERAVSVDALNPLALSMLARQRLEAGQTLEALLASAALGDVAPWFAGSDTLQTAAETGFLRGLNGSTPGSLS